MAGGKTGPQVLMAAVRNEITLQINLCAGDLAYGATVVRALADVHRPAIKEVLVVADACRPQSTPLLHAPSRFPAARFAADVARLSSLVEELRSGGVVDRIVWLEPDTVALRALNRRYAGVATACSHDHWGHAFSAYFLGWDAPRTRYVAHFDADILLWQQPGFDWLAAAINALENDPTLVGASPRIAPPPATDAMVRVGAPGSGWLPTWPLEQTAHGWRSPWFSTRCHVIDRARLAALLPLGGRRPHRRDAAINAFLAPLYGIEALTGTQRGPAAGRLAKRIPPFPLPPEVLLHEHAQARGFRCLYLRDPRAWFIHPDTKTETFLQLLPRLLDAVGRRGAFPPEQQGVSGVQFAAWNEFSL